MSTSTFRAKRRQPLLTEKYHALNREFSRVLISAFEEGHRRNLVRTDEYMHYYGYWSFEAAAICVIHGIDDTPFRDHMYYPKDLAEWARAHGVRHRLRPDTI